MAQSNNVEDALVEGAGDATIATPGDAADWIRPKNFEQKKANVYGEK